VSAEQERRDQQAEIDAEVAASAAMMRVHRVREQSHDRRDHVPAYQQATAGDDTLRQRVAVAAVMREQFLDACERQLAVLQCVIRRREASNLRHRENFHTRA